MIQTAITIFIIWYLLLAFTLTKLYNSVNEEQAKKYFNWSMWAFISGPIAILIVF